MNPSNENPGYDSKPSGSAAPVVQVGRPRGVMVKAMDCGIVVSEYVLQSRYYVYFRANALGKALLKSDGILRRVLKIRGDLLSRRLQDKTPAKTGSINSQGEREIIIIAISVEMI